VLFRSQLRDALLVQLMGQRAERALKVPGEQEIDKFIADNPVMFAERKILAVDRIQFAMPKNVDQLKALENDHSMEAVAARLKQMGIEFRRDATQIDSAALGQQRLQQIRVVTVGVVTGERAEPVPAANARPMAVQAIRNKQMSETMQQRLKQSRTSAEIQYQPGFAPAPEKGTPTKK